MAQPSFDLNDMLETLSRALEGERVDDRTLHLALSGAVVMLAHQVEELSERIDELDQQRS